MSAAPDLVRQAPGTAAANSPALAPQTGLARRMTGRLGAQWMPRAAWTLRRTGRPGMAGLALLFAAALFLFSTHLKMAAEVESLRADLAAAQATAARRAEPPPDPAAGLRALPSRSDIPDILRQVFAKASQSGLSVENGKYDLTASAGSRVVRYQVSFPVTGAYPQIRSFIDVTLATIPSVALSDLALDRKSISDAAVEAQLRMTIFTRSGP